jgi:hypothetical protein
MVVVEVELDGVVAHRRGASHFDDILPIHRKRIGLDSHGGGSVAARGTWATLAQVGVGVGGLVAVAPLDEHTARRRQLDADGSKIHEVLKLAV